MIDIYAKQVLREFFQGKINEDKKRAGMFKTAGGFTVREAELERFLDEAWVHLNKGLMEHGQATQ